MKTGTVKWFNARKGYGFIKPADGGFDVYVHVGAVERAGIGELKEGQTVTFDIVEDERTGEIFAENLSLLPDGKEPAPGGATEPVVQRLPFPLSGMAWQSAARIGARRGT
jgi:CspA family cold shock protein